MTQTINHSDPAVAALQESVRHNEKNIDKLDRDLKDFRLEVLKQFEKVDQQFDKVNDRFNDLENKFEQRLDKIDQRFEKVEQRFEKVDQRFDKMSDRFNQLETKVNDRFNQMTMLLVAIVGLMVTVIVKLFVFD